MKHLKLAALAGSAILVGSLVLAGSAAADEQGPGLQIVRVDYNVKGVDTAANAYQEVVRVQNKGTLAPLAGCTLEDLTGHTYRFPAAFTLNAGAYVDVRTGRNPANGSLTSWWTVGPNLYWGRTAHQYGNASDSVTLECSGVRQDRVSWSDFTIRP